MKKYRTVFFLGIILVLISSCYAVAGAVKIIDNGAWAEDNRMHVISIETPDGWYQKITYTTNGDTDYKLYSPSKYKVKTSSVSYSGILIPVGTELSVKASTGYWFEDSTLYTYTVN